MKNFLNYLGQLRLYSLADLILLLAVSGARQSELFGAVLLHVGFLAYLESRHGHSYRKSIVPYLWIVLGIAGILLYGHIIAAILFAGASYAYTLKTKKSFGIYSPFIRGMQYLFLIGGIAGFTAALPWIAFPLIVVRNLAGDFRDIEKDKNESMRTMPIALGFKKNIPHIHLISTLITSCIWWSFGSISVAYLLIVLLIEIATYDLTPR